MRFPFVFPLLLLCSATAVPAQVSVGIQLPGVSIGINQPVYPDLVPVPGYPVYYAPGSDLNYFFYDGLYWVYQADGWYASSWYNGPWRPVTPDDVPLFVLRVPVRYYRRPPEAFRGWRAEEPPHWGERWGHGWDQRHRGWEQWDRHAGPERAQLPSYQRGYHGDRYPREIQRQESLHRENYRYQPKEDYTRQHYQQGGGGTRGNQQREEQGGQGRGQGFQKKYRPGGGNSD